jgi:hypothetical protein
MRAWLAAAALVAVASPARAGWGAYVWGMSPEQVIVASKGAARPFEPTSANVTMSGRIEKARGEYVFRAPRGGEPLHFRMSFLFHPDDLRQVTLSARVPPAQCAPWEAELRAQYGAPYAVRDIQLNADSQQVVNTFWRDPLHDTAVQLNRQFGETGACLTFFAPLQELKVMTCEMEDGSKPFSCTYSGPKP